MALKVGELYALLGLDDKQFHSKLSGAQAAWQQVAGKMSGAGSALTAGVTAPIVAGAAAIFKLASDTGSLAERLGNLSQATGLSTKTLQELKFISEDAGLEFEGVTRASSMVQRKLMGVENDSGAAADTFKRLGIDIHDSTGQLKSMDILFPQLISKFQSMTNVTERNMLAAQVFGRGVNEIAPILGMTGAEMDKMRARAAELGLVMSDAGLKDAKALDDALDDMKHQFAGVFRSVAMQVIPILKDSLLPLIQENIIPGIMKLAGWVGALFRWFEHLPAGARKTILMMIGLAAAIGPTLLIAGQFAGALSSISGLLTLMPGLAAGMGGGLMGLLPIIAVVVASLIALWSVMRTMQMAAEWWEEREAAREAKEQAKRGAIIAEEYIKKGTHEIRKEQERRAAEAVTSGAMARGRAAALAEEASAGQPQTLQDILRTNEKQLEQLKEIAARQPAAVTT